MFPIRCATVVELRLQQMGDIYEKPHFTVENAQFGEAVKLGLKIFHQTTKRHTLTSNLVKQIVWLCGSDVVLTLYGGEKKSTRESTLETRCRL